ncbi:type I restriction enzyme M protein [Spinactinospora alkalitolerans]|uniref:site-specific DNA-methyltransferase (adenine-specific) n=1 Tax=Spinactinospora alkalitolerans TaxID=687207 RepID=A0A852TW05_9ACTN|nr:class I SAM-dependent DNA methyltransferase [Spinactinospora alkalitolerans]NYE47575.1 type I restriction enzyme M protein [Spinactinospora alkalitolerans]
MNNSKHQELVGFIWSVADLLRGDFKQSEYGKVILPFTVLRRLDCVLEQTKDEVRAAHEKWKGKPVEHQMLLRASGQSFYNTGRLTLEQIADDPSQAAKHLSAYIGAFSDNAAEVLEKYDFPRQIARLDDAGLLYRVLGRFADLDLHPERVSNVQMGYVFEELIRKFSEVSNETAGEHFTPREVIRLMVNLLLAPDEDVLRVPGTIREVLDPACGTGGMLTETHDHIRAVNPHAKVVVSGQELNAESWAICRSDLMIKGQDPKNIAFGNSFGHDRHYGGKFDYMLANPPFGVEWKKVKDEVETEHESLGFSGRFGAGLPRINDGSLLFLQHMIAKMKPVQVEEDGRRTGGSRIAIVFNGSPLFTGAAESGESRIRQWILENDWLEAIVALPDQLFYNTGISTYFWILTNRKEERHKGRVVLVDAREHFAKMRKSLGDKRKYVTDEQIDELTRLYADASTVAENPEHPLHDKVKVFDNEDFGYHRITVERPLKLRFEVTEEALTELEATLKTGKALAKYEYRDQLLDALRPLVGEKPGFSRTEFAGRLKGALAEGGVGKPPANVDKAIWAAVSVRDPEGEVQKKRGGAVEPDPELRDYENVPLKEDIDAYLEREVLPHVPDAWIDHEKTKIGYEIPLTRHFYKYVPPRPLEEIDAELDELEAEIQNLLRKVKK